MLRTRLAWAAALWAMSAAPLWAQTPPALAGDPPDGSPFVVVDRLAKGDLLNVRAAASALGRTLGRLPNGTVLRNLGCGEFDGYKWCEVEALDEAAGLKGWTPSRYLFASLPPEGVAAPARPPADGAPLAAGPDVATESPSAAPAQAPQAAAAIAPFDAPRAEDEPAGVAAPGPAEAADEQPASSPVQAAPTQSAPPLDLSARMSGEAAPPPSLETLRRSAAATPEGGPPAAEPAGEEKPAAIAETAPARSADVAAQAAPAPPLASPAAEPASPASASPVFYDGFLRHGAILWAVAALAALVFGFSGGRQGSATRSAARPAGTERSR